MQFWKTFYSSKAALIVMKPRKPKAVTARGGIRRAISFLRRKRLWPREKRTPQNPVRVVFVCPEGGTSERLASLFSEKLKNEKISSIRASSIAISPNYENRPRMPARMRQLPEAEVMKALANADIISHAINTPGPLSRLRQLAPGCIMIGPTYYDIGKDFSPLLRLVRKNFKLKK